MNLATEMEALVTSLDAWNIPSDTVESVRSRSRESLDEVKGLVDHQDKAASGMLTVVAFLTAAASLVYQRFASDYYFPAALDSPTHSLTFATYFVFLVYLLLVSISALLVFHALLPRYTEPDPWKKGLRGGPNVGAPFSTLYYLGILSISPSQWGTFFTSLKRPRSENGTSYGAEIDELYAKFGIIESYLVALDVRKKVQAVAHAGWALRASMILLICFAALYGATTMSAKPDRTTASSAASSATPNVNAAPSSTPTK